MIGSGNQPTNGHSLPTRRSEAPSMSFDENHGDRMLGYALLYMLVLLISGIGVVAWRLW